MGTSTPHPMPPRTTDRNPDPTTAWATTVTVALLVLPVALAVVLELAALPTAAEASPQPPSRATPEGDLRLPLVERVLANQPAEALAGVETSLAYAPEEAREMGLSYLRGRLLEQLDRPDAATDAYRSAMDEAPELRPWVRYRLALAEERAGHPEIAAGLIAGVIDPSLPDDLVERAVRLLARALFAGGDCRMLQGVPAQQLGDEERRLLILVKAECAERQGQGEMRISSLRRLLEEKVSDEPARLAADRLEALSRTGHPSMPGGAEGVEIDRLVGLTLHHHREYDRSIPILERVARALTTGRVVSGDKEFEVRYALARGTFWQERHQEAADLYGDLALRSRTLEERGRLLYQQARSLELAGQWGLAATTFERAYATAPDGDYAGPALLSILRLRWRSGRETPALATYRTLVGHRRSGGLAARGALFLASSDLVRGRTDRAETWLADALRLDGDTELEVAYWRGRRAELQAQVGPTTGGGAAIQPTAIDRTYADRAVDHYLEVILDDPYHPLAQDALQRLDAPLLAAAAEREGRRRAQLPGLGDAYAAWLILDGAHPGAIAARRTLDRAHQRNAGLAPFLRLREVPVPRWPLWEPDPEHPQSMLLALGLFDEGAARVREEFPSSRPELQYTGGLLLARAGEIRQSILVGIALEQRIQRLVEPPLVPTEIRRLRYPLAWGDTVRRQARRFGVDPALVAAVIRSESSYDPQALSPVSARGLMQFVWLTARRLAPQVGFEQLRPEDLYRPNVSITLGSAYLGELLESSDGLTHQAVAAYNAGPPQAELWQKYCYSRDPAEYFTKTGFTETRNYLARVLSARAVYEELYRFGSTAPGE